VSCENNGGQDIKNIKIELCKSYSSDEDIKEIKKIIINTGNFVIYPKVDDGHLLVSISLEKVDSFSGNSAKEVIVPLPKNKVHVGLVKDPLLIKKPETDQGRVHLRTPIENEKVMNTVVPVADFSDVCERVRAILSSWGFKAQIHYISVVPNKIGATINCTSEGIGEIRKKFTSTYSAERVWGKPDKKTVKVRKDFDLDTSPPEEYVVKKDKTWAERFSDSEEEIQSMLEIKESNTTHGHNGSISTNIFEPISLVNADTKTQQTLIQITQKIEKMKKTQEKKLRDHIKSLIKSLGLSAKVYYQITQTEDGHLDMYLRDVKDSAKFKDLSGVEVSGKHIYFSPHFIHGSDKKTTTLTKAKTLEKKKNEGNDILEDLFNKIREIKTGSDLSKVVEKFEEVYPGQTLWLQEGESIKKISIEVLLKKILN
jgi:hypothetical protein